MSTLQIILAVFQLLSGLAVTAIVLMQSGKSAGLSGAISGGADNFLSKGKATPFEGWRVAGVNVLTVCDGKIAYTRSE